MTCPVCGEAFEFAASGENMVPWPASGETIAKDLDSQFTVSERTKTGAVEVCRDAPRGEVTFYVHVDDT